MKKLIENVFIGRVLHFPKQFIYLMLSLTTLSLSKQINGDQAYFEGDWIIYLSVLLFLFFIASTVLTLIKKIKLKNKNK
jgi:hypothetical protein